MYTSEETCCGVRKSLTMLIKSRVHLQVPALEIFPFAIYTFIIKKKTTEAKCINFFSRIVFALIWRLPIPFCAAFIINNVIHQCLLPETAPADWLYYISHSLCLYKEHPKIQPIYIYIISVFEIAIYKAAGRMLVSFPLWALSHNLGQGACVKAAAV